MKKASLVALAAFAAAMLGASPSFADSITLYGNSEQPPKAWLDNGTPKGFGVEAAVAVLKRAGFEVTVQLVPFARGMALTKEGGIMTGVFHSAERAKSYDYSEPLVFEDVVVVVQKGKEFTFENAQDLKGKKIGMQVSFFYGADFDSALPQLTTEGDPSPSTRLKKLAAGRIDVALLNPGRAAFIRSAAEGELKPEDFTVLAKPLAKLANHLIVGKGVAGGAEMLARVNKAIAEANADGTLAKIMANYEQ